MHPAYSIIFFTVLSGLGYGLAAMLGLGLLDPVAVATRLAHVVALSLIGGGLVSSTLHLGNPRRAWRALSQWRSSWLSREGVMALVTFVPLAVAASVSIFRGEALPLIGLIGTLCAAVTVWCTSMIYASLKSVDAWHTPLTGACYLAFAAAGGLTAATFFAFAGQSPRAPTMALCAAAALMLAWLLKRRWRERMRTMPPRSTPESATGLGGLGKVRLFEPPHMTDNYLTREMGFKVARKHAEKLIRIAVLLGGVLPAVLLLCAATSLPLVAALLAGAALGLHLVGMLVERWLFFAEARHAVMSYYGS